jgi:hypothetical protein
MSTVPTCALEQRQRFQQLYIPEESRWRSTKNRLCPNRRDSPVGSDVREIGTKNEGWET